MTLAPSPKVIVLKKIEQATKTLGGLIIPDNASAEANSQKTAEVCEVGKDVKLVKIGDKVAFNHYNATAVNFGRETGTLIFCVEDNILAIIR